MISENTDRRLACIRITGELMQSMFFTESRPDQWFQVQQGIPADAKFVRWYIEEERNELRMVYEHESFERTYPGQTVPYIDRPILRACHVTIEEVEEAHRRRMIAIIKGDLPSFTTSGVFDHLDPDATVKAQ